jgi:SAM-dependent methyltransferase
VSRGVVSLFTKAPAYLVRYGATFFGAFRRHAARFDDKVGLEVGGPSVVFRTLSALPVYRRARRIDGVNFAAATMWEGRIVEGMTYRYARGKVGRQFIGEASDLAMIESSSYDFLISSHALEHCANALQTLTEWCRVVKPGGDLLLVVPRKQDTFDHRRPVTTFEHLLEDAARRVDESDLTHLDEIVELHDLARDVPGLTVDAFRERSLKNFENRGLHHHVFDEALLRKMFDHLNISTVFVDYARPAHLIIMGRIAEKESSLSAPTGRSRASTSLIATK